MTNSVIDPDKKEYLLTNHVKFLHKVAIFWAGKVLLLQRPANDFARPNGWDLPGGNSNWPESVKAIENPHLEDLAREIKEETGLRIDTARVKPVYLVSSYDPVKVRYIILVGYRLDLSKNPGKVRVHQPEHQDFCWAKIKEVNGGQFDFGPGGEFIGEIIKRASGV